MRSRVFFPLLLLPLSVACTAILGDFSVGGGGDGGDSGGGDVSNPEGGPDGGGSLLTCDEVNTERKQVTQNASLHARSLHAAMLPNQMLRVAFIDIPPQDGGFNPSTLHAYTIDPHNVSNFQDAPLPTNSGQVLALIRYPGQPGGFAAMWVGYDQNTNTSYLYASLIPDNATSWTTPWQLSKVSTSNNNAEGSFIVQNPANNEYYVVFSSLENNSTQQVIVAGHTAGTADQLQQVGSFPATSKGAQYDLMAPGIAMDGTQAYILLNQNTNGPPQPGLTELMLVPGKSDVTITPPSNLNYLPFGFTNSPDPLKANALWLSADLSAEQGSYLAGRVSFADLATWDPAKLTPSTPPPQQADAGFSQLSQLAFNNPPHWENVPNNGEQLLITAPTIDPLFQKFYGGINFGWWDAATGALRAYKAGANHLFGDIPFIVGSDATFISIAGSLVQIELAYLNAPQQPQGDYPPPAADLWVAQIGCQK